MNAIAQTSAPALEISGATVPGRLHDLSLQLPSGVLAGLVGPNGSGKSTLLQVAAGLLDASGTVAWNGRPIARMPILERGRHTTWVPQEARFEFGFSVRSVVAQARFAHGDDANGVAAALERFDLNALAERPVNQLSGGERQRVLLARALATGAALHLWDEPLAPLDIRHALETLRLAGELARDGATVLLSLHDLRVAYRLPQVIVLDRGRLRAAGPPADVLTPPLLRDVFGIRMRMATELVLELPENPGEE